MTKVLLAVDGSALAVRAAQRAMAMLDADSEVVVLAVVRPMSMASADASGLAGVGPVPSLVEETNERAEQAASEDAHDVIEALGRVDTARTLVERGEPGATICRVAAREAVDVIVVGSHGRGIVQRALMGSVSNHVLHHATCPVLVVRDEPSSGGSSA